MLQASHSPLRRAGALLQAALFFLSLSLAPAIHGRLCDDVCARQSAGAESASCHGHEDGAKSDCQCLGDCCSISACSVTPEAPSDGAPPSALPTGTAPADPEATPRAPGAWLLPYPTGPPPAA